MSRPAATALACALMAPVALGACGKGGPSDQQQVRTTLQRFARAVAAHDYRTVCTQLLAPSLTDRLVQINLPCESGLAKGFGLAQSPTLTVRSIHVSGTRASAVVHSAAANQVPSDDTVALVKTGGAWRIAALAPAPAAPAAKAPAKTR
jgi:hypothetical protein